MSSPLLARQPRHVHVIGAGGIVTSQLMAVLRQHVPLVTGSDENILPPADGILARAGFQIPDGFTASQVAATVDLAVVNATIPRGNPELEEVLRRRIPLITWPALLPRLNLLAPRNGVVAGTDGKTTTSCMWSWIMDASGRSCDRVIGGKVATWEGGVRLEGGAHCILEGDEYPCGIGDRSPKFLHYRPEIAIITNVHFDHPDAFHCEAEVMDCYRGLLDLLPEDGLLVVNYDDKNCRQLMKQAHCPVLGVGFSKGAPIRLKGLRHSPDGVTFSVEGASFHLPLAGRMNAANAAAATLAARHWGVSLEESAHALRTFPGAEGRQIYLRRDDTLVLASDTAYHPHAVGELLRAMRGRYPGRRVCLVLQPRHTAGEGNWQQRLWPRVLRHADICMITDALNPEGGPRSHFDAAKVASTAGARVTHVGAPDRAGELFDKHLRAGDVWVLCLADWFAQPRMHITDAALAFMPQMSHPQA